MGDCCSIDIGAPAESVAVGERRKPVDLRLPATGVHVTVDVIVVGLGLESLLLVTNGTRRSRLLSLPFES